jgi:hypothetical protein
VIQPEIEPADQGQTLIAIAWAIDSSNQLIASCAPVFGRRSTVSQDENVLFACGSPTGAVDWFYSFWEIGTRLMDLAA